MFLTSSYLPKIDYYIIASAQGSPFIVQALSGIIKFKEMHTFHVFLYKQAQPGFVGGQYLITATLLYMYMHVI